MYLESLRKEISSHQSSPIDSSWDIYYQRDCLKLQLSYKKAEIGTVKHIPLPRERCYLPWRNHLLAEKTLSHWTTGTNLLGPDKTIEFPSFPSRSGIKANLPQASSSSHVHATTRRGLDTDCASSAIQWLKECQRTFSPRLYPVVACN